MKSMMALVAVAGSLAAGAFEVEQVFRPERYGRGDTNVRPQQAIDEASWIWLEGLDVWGAAVFTETRAKGLEKVPSYFVRFRRDFETVADEPLEIDVSADERYVLLLDGRDLVGYFIDNELKWWAHEGFPPERRREIAKRYFAVTRRRRSGTRRTGCGRTMSDRGLVRARSRSTTPSAGCRTGRQGTPCPREGRDV